MQDTSLLNPYLIAASDSGVYVYDGAEERVLAFGSDGRLMWRYGRSGAGPNEFLGVRDLKAAPDGEVFVLDARNSRVVHLKPNGKVRSRIPLQNIGHAEQMALLETGDLLLLTMDPESAFVVIDTAGIVTKRFSLPWAGFAKLDPIARQGVIASNEQLDWIFGFSMGNGWFSFENTAPKLAGQYIERTDFPEIQRLSNGGSKMAEYNACSACSISASGSTLYVHFGGYSNAHMKIVDRYNLETGTYIDSYRLPGSATAISVAGNRIYVLVEEPHPMVIALTPRKNGGSAE